MSLPTLAFTVLSLVATPPDLCYDARDMAIAIAQNRDLGVPVSRIMEVFDDLPMWRDFTVAIYLHPNVPPLAVGATMLSACRAQQ